MYISRKIISFLMIISLLWQNLLFAQVTPKMVVPAYLQGYTAKDKYRPMHLRYLSFDPLKEEFNLILDKGYNQSLLNQETKKLIEYFQIGLRLPNDTFWVNLRPDAQNEVIDSLLEKTDLGRILLESDLQLKKDLSGFMDPDTKEGKNYWNLLYKKANEIFPNENIKIPTLVRPWIVPGEIILGETDSGAYIYKATLKVMLEQDYLKNDKLYNFEDQRYKQLNDYAAQIIRDDILLKLTREVNSSKKYAPLRQVYYSLIIAQWFKLKYSRRILEDNEQNEIVKNIDSQDLTTLTSKAPWDKDTYYKAYQKSFQKGEYHKEALVPNFNGVSVRNYTSGGMKLKIDFKSQDVSVAKANSRKFSTTDKYERKVCDLNGDDVKKDSEDLLNNEETCSDCGGELVPDYDRWEYYCSVCGLTQEMQIDLSAPNNVRYNKQGRIIQHKPLGSNIVYPNLIKSIMAAARSNPSIALKIYYVYEEIKKGRVFKRVIKEVKDNNAQQRLSEEDLNKIIVEFSQYAFENLKTDINNFVKSNPSLFKDIEFYAATKGLSLNKREIKSVALGYPKSWKEKLDLFEPIRSYAKEKGIKLYDRQIFKLLINYSDSWEDKLDLFEQVKIEAENKGISFGQMQLMNFFLRYPIKWQEIFNMADEIREYAKSKNYELNGYNIGSLLNNNYKVWRQKLDLIEEVKSYGVAQGINLVNSDVLVILERSLKSWKNRLDLAKDIKNYGLTKGLKFSSSDIVFFIRSYYSNWKENIDLADSVRDYAANKKLKLAPSDVIYLVKGFPRTWDKKLDLAKDIKAYSQLKGVSLSDVTVIFLLKMYPNLWREKVDIMAQIQQVALDKKLNFPESSLKLIAFINKERREQILSQMFEAVSLARSYGLELSISTLFDFAKRNEKMRINENILVNNILSNFTEIFDKTLFWNLVKNNMRLRLPENLYNQFFAQLQEKENPAFQKYIKFKKAYYLDVVKNYALAQGMTLSDAECEYLLRSFTDWKNKIELMGKSQKDLQSQDINLSVRHLLNLVNMEKEVSDEVKIRIKNTFKLAKEFGIDVSVNAAYVFAVNNKNESLDLNNFELIFNKGTKIVDKEKFWKFIQNNPNLNLSRAEYDLFYEGINNRKEVYLVLYTGYLKKLSEDLLGQVKSFAFDKGLNLTEAEIIFFANEYPGSWRRKIILQTEIIKTCKTDNIKLPNTVLRNLIIFDEQLLNSRLPVLIEVIKLGRKFGLEITSSQAYQFALKNKIEDVDVEHLPEVVSLKSQIIDKDKFWKYVNEVDKNLLFEKEQFDNLFKNSSSLIITVEQYKKENLDKLIREKLIENGLELSDVGVKFIEAAFPRNWSQKVDELVQLKIFFEKDNIQLSESVLLQIIRINVEKRKTVVAVMLAMIKLGREYGLEISAKMTLKFAKDYLGNEVNVNSLGEIVSDMTKILDKEKFRNYTLTKKELTIYKEAFDKFFELYENKKGLNFKKYTEYLQTVKDDGGRGKKQSNDILDDDNLCPICQIEWEVDGWEKYCPKCGLVEEFVNLSIEYNNGGAHVYDVRGAGNNGNGHMVLGGKIVTGKIIKQLMAAAYNHSEVANKLYSIFEQLRNGDALSKVLSEIEDKDSSVKSNLKKEDLDKMIKDFGKYAFTQLEKDAKTYIKNSPQLYENAHSYALSKGLKLTKNQTDKLLLYYSQSWKQKIDLVDEIRQFAQKQKIKLTNTHLSALIIRFPNIWLDKLSLFDDISQFAEQEKVKLTSDDILTLILNYSNNWKDKFPLINVIEQYALNKGIKLTPSDLKFLAIQCSSNWQKKIDAIDEIKEYAGTKGIKLTDSNAIFMIKTYWLSWKEKLDLFDIIKSYAKSKKIKVSSADALYLLSNFPQSWENKLNLGEDIKSYSSDKKLDFTDADIVFFLKAYPNNWKEKIDLMAEIRDSFRESKIEINNSLLRRLSIYNSEREKLLPIFKDTMILAMEYGLYPSVLSAYEFVKEREDREFLKTDLKKIISDTSIIINKENFWKYVTQVDSDLKIERKSFDYFFELYKNKKNPRIKSYAEYVREVQEDGGNKKSKIKDNVEQEDICPECGVLLTKDNDWESFCPVCGLTQMMMLDLSLESNFGRDYQTNITQSNISSEKMVSANTIRLIMAIAYNDPVVARKVNYLYERVREGRKIEDVLRQIRDNANPNELISDKEQEELVVRFGKDAFKQLYKDIKNFVLNNPNIFQEVKYYAAKKDITLTISQIGQIVTTFPKSWKNIVDLIPKTQEYAKSKQVHLSISSAVQLVITYSDSWQKILDLSDKIREYADKEKIVLNNTDIVAYMLYYANSWREKFVLIEEITKYAESKNMDLSQRQIVDLSRKFPKSWQEKFHVLLKIREEMQNREIDISDKRILYLVTSWQEQELNKFLQILIDIIALGRQNGLQISLSSALEFSRLNNLDQVTRDNLSKVINIQTKIVDPKAFWEYSQLDKRLSLDKESYNDFFATFNKNKLPLMRQYTAYVNSVKKVLEKKFQIEDAKIIIEMKNYALEKKLKLTDSVLAELLGVYPNTWQGKIDLAPEIKFYAKTKGFDLTDSEIATLFIRNPNNWQDNIKSALDIKAYADAKGLKLSDSDVKFLFLFYPNSWRNNIDLYESIKEYADALELKLSDSDIIYIFLRFPESWSEKVDLVEVIWQYALQRKLDLSSADAVYLMKKFGNTWKDIINLAPEIRKYADDSNISLTEGQVILLLKGYPNVWQEKINILIKFRDIFYKENIKLTSKLTEIIIQLEANKRDSVTATFVELIKLAKEYGLEITITQALKFAMKNYKQPVILNSLSFVITDRTKIVDLDKFWDYVSLLNPDVTKESFDVFIENLGNAKIITWQKYKSFAENQENADENINSILAPRVATVSDDGGKGGIDLRKLSEDQLMVSGLQIKENKVSAELISQKWQSICKTTKLGIVPLEQLKHFFNVCNKNSESKEEYNLAYAYILDILRLEEEQAVVTNQKLKEIVAILN